MNRTRIDWADYSWNVLTGCLHGCPYCYARKIAERFQGSKAFPRGFDPTWHPERLTEPLHVKRPSRIFVCSMADPFGDWVPGRWIEEIWGWMKTASWHRFLFLTKRPQNIVQKLGVLAHQPMPHVWLGCTLTGAKGEQDPSSSMCELQDIGWHVFVSIEPLLGPVNPEWYEWAEWVILGAMTGPGKVRPSPEWITWHNSFTKLPPLFVKGNLVRYWPELAGLQQYPDSLKLRENAA